MRREATISYTNPQPQTFRQFTQRFDYAVSSHKAPTSFFRWTRAHYTKAGYRLHDRRCRYPAGSALDRYRRPSAGITSSARPPISSDVKVGRNPVQNPVLLLPRLSAIHPRRPRAAELHGHLCREARHTLPLILSISNYQGIGQQQQSRLPYYRTLASSLQSSPTFRATTPSAPGAEWRQQNFCPGQPRATSFRAVHLRRYLHPGEQRHRSKLPHNPTGGLSYAAFLTGDSIPQFLGFVYLRENRFQLPILAFYGWRYLARYAQAD